jgi:preprotein translocase subunit SecE
MAGTTVKPTTGTPAVTRQASLLRYLRESRSELRKVNWPSREQTTNLTIVVVVVCLALAFFMFGFDTLFAKIITSID